jgi:hypothetical protein
VWENSPIRPAIDAAASLAAALSAPYQTDSGRYSAGTKGVHMYRDRVVEFAALALLVVLVAALYAGILF